MLERDPVTAATRSFLLRVTLRGRDASYLVYDLRTGARITTSTEVCCGPIPAAGHVFVAGIHGVEALVPS